MTEIRFYQLHRTSLDQALPGILEKVIERGWRAVVMAGSEPRVEQLDALLWTYRNDSFLPHGAPGAPQPAEQPIWLTTADENPNGAEVLILTDGAGSDRIGSFRLCCELFDGGDPEAVAEARRRWRAYKAAGHDLTYWQQGERGGWEKRG